MAQETWVLKFLLCSFRSPIILDLKPHTLERSREPAERAMALHGSRASSTGCTRGRKERREGSEGEDRVEATVSGPDAKVRLGFPVVLLVLWLCAIATGKVRLRYRF